MRTKPVIFYLFNATAATKAIRGVAQKSARPLLSFHLRIKEILKKNLLIRML